MIKNLGTTCYIASILQSIYETPLFKEFLAIKASEENLSVIARICNDLNYKKTLKSKDVKFLHLGFSNSNEQNDCGDFYTFLLQNILSSLNPNEKNFQNDRFYKENFDIKKTPKEFWNQFVQNCRASSNIKNLAYGIFLKTINCSSDSCTKTHSLEIFDQIILRTSNEKTTLSVQELLLSFEMEEKLQVKCSKCGKMTPQTHKIEILKFPPLLVFNTSCVIALQNKIQIPSKLKIDCKFKEEKLSYNLHSINFHHGISSSEGHFTSLRRSKEKFLHFDDDKIPKEIPFYSQTLSSNVNQIFYCLDEKDTFSTSIEENLDTDELFNNWDYLNPSYIIEPKHKDPEFSKNFDESFQNDGTKINLFNFFETVHKEENKSPQSNKRNIQKEKIGNF